MAQLIFMNSFFSIVRMVHATAFSFGLKYFAFSFQILGKLIVNIFSRIMIFLQFLCYQILLVWINYVAVLHDELHLKLQSFHFFMGHSFFSPITYSLFF